MGNTWTNLPRAWQSLLMLSEFPSTILPKRAVEIVAEQKEKQVLALLSLCCPHLHLVSSEALRLGGSTIAISLGWAFAEIYRILGGKPASLPICDHALGHFFCWTFCVRRLKVRSVCGAVDLPLWGYSSHRQCLRCSQPVN